MGYRRGWCGRDRDAGTWHWQGHWATRLGGGGQGAQAPPTRRQEGARHGRWPRPWHGAAARQGRAGHVVGVSGTGCGARARRRWPGSETSATRALSPEQDQGHRHETDCQLSHGQPCSDGLAPRLGPAQVPRGRGAFIDTQGRVAAVDGHVINHLRSRCRAVPLSESEAITFTEGRPEREHHDHGSGGAPSQPAMPL